MIKNCLTCFQPYEARSHLQKFCSEICLYLGRIDKNGPNGCWVWLGKLGKNRYPKMSHRVGEDKRVHQFSYRHHVGPIPEGKILLHTCDNPICSNPKHLVVGTFKENMRDMKKKGRGGDFRRKLTDEQVKEIFDSPESASILGARFDVHYTLIHKIRRGERKTDITLV